jgi:serine/threonine protein kinase
MSPEQAMGGAMTVCSDIYSFGILIYEMLTGALPFSGSNARNRMRKRLTTNPTPMRTYLAGADIELETVTHRCLSLDPNDRFNRAIEVAVALGPHAQQLSCAVNSGAA